MPTAQLVFPVAKSGYRGAIAPNPPNLPPMALVYVLRNARIQPRFILTRVEVPPAAFFRVILDRQFLIAAGALPTQSFLMLQLHVNQRLLLVQPHFRDRPWFIDPQYLRVKILDLHRHCPPQTILSDPRRTRKNLKKKNEKTCQILLNGLAHF